MRPNCEPILTKKSESRPLEDKHYFKNYLHSVLFNFTSIIPQQGWGQYLRIQYFPVLCLDSTSCSHKLQDTLRSMRLWLKRVETSRIRQRLRQEAQGEKRETQSHHPFVDSNRVLAPPNKALAWWIRRQFEPSPNLQTTMNMFFSP